MTTWNAGNRERALEALRIVLGGIEGVQTVRRQPPPMNVSDNEIPAIYIDDARGVFDWQDRHGDRLIRTQSRVVLDCHALAKQVQGRHQYSDGPTLRNLFARRIMLELADNPTLSCTIPNVDDEDTAHTRDSARRFELNNVPVPLPYIRFQLIIDLDVDDDLDQRTRTEWKNAILTVQPEQPGIVLPSEKEVTFPLLSHRDYFLVEHYDDLLGLWTFEGPAFNDQSQNGYDLASYEPTPPQLTPAAPIYDGGAGSTRFGGGVAWRRLTDSAAASFNINRGAYDLGNLLRSQSFTVSALVRRDADSGADQAIAGWAGPSGAYWQLYTNDAGETGIKLLGNDAGNALVNQAGGASEIGELVHHLVVVDREADELRCYQNGTEVVTVSNITASVGGLEAHANSVFAIGAYAVGPITSTAVETPTAVQIPFSGRVSVVAVLSRALDDSEATRLRDIAGLG